MRINIAIAALIWTILAAFMTAEIVELTSQDDHLINVHTKNYVLAIMYDSKVRGMQKDISQIANYLAQSNTIMSNVVTVELIDLKALPFFDDHYDLLGQQTIRFFIRDQMIKNPDLDEKMSTLSNKNIKPSELAADIERWVADKIMGISIEITHINKIRELVHKHRILGFYSGTHGSNFDKFYRVAQKNIDLQFCHTFDPKLAEQIYTEYGRRAAPEGDNFAIIREASSLTEFDPSALISFNNFNERELTEFIEYERYDKLRLPHQFSNISSKLFHKHQPLLLFASGENTSKDQLKTFTDAIKQLPKNIIYAHTDVNSNDAGVFHRLFVMASQAVVPGSLNIVHVTADKKVIITPFKKTFSVEKIKSFAEDFMKENAKFFANVRNFLYDKIDTIKGEHNDKEIIDKDL